MTWTKDETGRRHLEERRGDVEVRAEVTPQADGHWYQVSLALHNRAGTEWPLILRATPGYLLDLLAAQEDAEQQVRELAARFIPQGMEAEP